MMDECVVYGLRKWNLTFKINRIMKPGLVCLAWKIVQTCPYIRPPEIVKMIVGFWERNKAALLIVSRNQLLDPTELIYSSIHMLICSFKWIKSAGMPIRHQEHLGVWDTSLIIWHVTFAPTELRWKLIMKSYYTYEEDETVEVLYFKRKISPCTAKRQ